MKTGETLSDLQVIVTNRLTTVSGQLTDCQGTPVDGTVIVFSSNAETWLQDSRFVRAARTVTEGDSSTVSLRLLSR
jgi:hypothetical protein